MAKRKSVYDARKHLRDVMRECCESGNHKAFYVALKDYKLEPGTPEYASAVDALLEFCRRLRSRPG